MLTALREGAKNSLLMKIIVFGFIGLGVGGLVLMDVQGFFRDGGLGNRTIVAAGPHQVGIQEFDQRLRRVINEQQIPQELAYRFGFPASVARAVGNELMVQTYADQLGLRPDDASVAEALRRYIDPNRGEDETASETLRRVAASVGVSSNRFIEVVEDTITRGLIIDAYEGSASIINDSLKQAYLKSSAQRRDVEAIYLKDSDQSVQAPEDDAVLKAHYEGIKSAMFAIPQEKQLRYAILDMATFEKKATQPSDEDIQTYYNQNQDRFKKPARVALAQAVVKDEAQAAAIRDAVDAGTALSEAVQSVTGSNDAFRSSSEFTQSGLPPALGTAVFDQDAAVIGPVETAFGFHVALVEARLAEETVPLGDIKDDISKEILSLSVEENFFSLLDRVEDRATQQATLDNLANEFDLDIITITNVKSDQASRLKLKDDDEPAETVFPALYNQNTGEVGPLTALGDTRYLIAETTLTKPESYTPYEAVKSKVLSDWRTTRRAQAGRAKAMEITGAAGKTLRDHGLPVKTYAQLGEYLDPPSPLNQAAMNSIFAAQTDAITQIRLDDGVLIFNVTNISFATPDPDGTEEALTQLQDVQAAAIVAGLQDYLNDNINIKINQHLLDTLYAPDETATPTGLPF